MLHCCIKLILRYHVSCQPDRERLCGIDAPGAEE
jgi:hypothetical protein